MGKSKNSGSNTRSEESVPEAHNSFVVTGKPRVHDNIMCFGKHTVALIHTCKCDTVPSEVN